MTYNELTLKIEEEDGRVKSIQEDLDELKEEETHFNEATPNSSTFHGKWFLIKNLYVRIDDFIIEEDSNNPEKYLVTKVHGIGFDSKSFGSITNVDSWFDISDIGTENTPSIETLNNIYYVRSN